MKVTICDFCQRKGHDLMDNKWVEVRFGDGSLANFFKTKIRKTEICYDCWQKLLEIFRDKTL